MARDDPQMKLRLSANLRDRIRKAAETNNRSMNAEIVFTLEEAYPPDNTIEDTIYFAKQIINEYSEIRDYARLRELREMLSELVSQLEGIRSARNADEDRDPKA